MHPEALPADWAFTGLRWMARLLSVLIVGLVMLIVAGEGIPHPPKGPLDVWIELVFFFTTCLGLILAWRWELIGGSIAFVSMILFYGVELAVNGKLAGGWVFGVMCTTGLLFMLCGLKNLMSHH